MKQSVNMNNSTAESSVRHVWILIGCGLFFVALAVSAWVVPALRVLHTLQSLLYVAIVFLARRNSPWAFGAGVAVPVAWNSLNLFVTHLMQAGAVMFWSSLHTGHVQRLDTMMVTVGGIGHFIIIGACTAAVLQLPAGMSKWWKFAGGGVLAIAYMALIIALALPR